MAAAAEAGEIDARGVNPIAFGDMVDEPVELVDLPILIGAKQGRDGEERESRIAVGDLRRAVDLDLGDIVAAFPRPVQKDQKRILLPRIGQIAFG